jgi:arsenate reductase (thioredoxin)
VPKSDEECDAMTTILFACVENTAQSQMAAALLNRKANPTRVVAISAGIRPGGAVPPVIVDVMAEAGIDVAGVRAQLLTLAIMRQADWVILMGNAGGVRLLPHLRRETWPVGDPFAGSMQHARRVREELTARIDELLARLEGHGGFGGRAA